MPSSSLQISEGACVAFLQVVRRGILFLSLLLFIILPRLNAQLSAAWAPVSPAELTLKDNPARSGSSAMLLDYEVYQDDLTALRTYYYRVKILNEEGTRYADVEIPYDSKQSAIEGIRARTTRPNGTTFDFQGEIFSKIAAKSKQTEVQVKTFVLPAVEAGSVIEYSYRITWHKYLPDVLSNPQGYLITGSYSFPSATWTLQQELYVRHETFLLRPLPKATLAWNSVRMPQGAEVQKQADGTLRVEANNIAPLEVEEFMPPENHLSSQVHFYYTVGLVSGPYTFWSAQNSQFEKELADFLIPDKTVETAVKHLIAPSDSAETRVRKLYARVQQIRNRSYERLKTEKEQKLGNPHESKNAADLLNRGYGVGNELNYLFVAMLRAAGLKAFLVRVADRLHGVLNPIVLDVSQLDAMVVMVQLDDRQLFLDPATRFCTYGLIPWAETGGRGISAAGPGGIIEVPGQDGNSAVKQRTADLTLSKDGTLNGTVEVSFGGQEALTRRLEFDGQDDAARRKAMDDEIKSWLPPGTKLEIKRTSNWDTSEGDLRIESEISIPNFAILTGHRLLFSPAVLQSNRAHRLYHGKRSYPVNFQYAYREVDSVTIKLPDGYEVEALPAPRTENDRIYRLETTYGVQGRTLQFHRVLVLNGFYFPVEAYDLVKSAFDNVEVSDGEKLVLHAEGIDTH